MSKSLASDSRSMYLFAISAGSLGSWLLLRFTYSLRFQLESVVELVLILTSSVCVFALCLFHSTRDQLLPCRFLFLLSCMFNVTWFFSVCPLLFLSLSPVCLSVYQPDSPVLPHWTLVCHSPQLLHLFYTTTL